MIHRIAAGILASTVVACAASATTVPPSHGSALAEERAAAEHDRAAGILERQAQNEEDSIKCGPAMAGTAGQICWASPRESGAAAHDRMHAAEQRDAAAEHRRVSWELRSVELRACADIAEADIADSPFSHREDIVDAEVIQGLGPDGKPQPLGARVRFHQIEHLTAAWLQHVVDCHLARNDAMGHDVPEMSYCPLVPRGATATVQVIPHGYVIEIRSTDAEGAREIARRAMALRP